MLFFVITYARILIIPKNTKNITEEEFSSQIGSRENELNGVLNQ